MIPNYYKTLGVSKNATKVEIKKAYRKLALQFHPDRNKAANAHEQFVEINEANLILSDDEARAKYNREYEYYFERNSNPYSSSSSQSKKNQEDIQKQGSYDRQSQRQDRGYSNFDDEELNRWAKNARQQGENFAKMAFDEFSKLVVGIVKETGFQLGNSIVMAFGAMLTMSGCGNLFIGLATKGETGNPILGIIFLPIGLLLWNFAQKRWDNHKV